MKDQKKKVKSYKMGYPTMNMAATGRNIKKIMSLRGLKVKDVQAFLGFENPQSIYHWLKGKSLPTLDHLYALSELFRISVDEIICGDRNFDPEAAKASAARAFHYYCRFDNSTDFKLQVQ